MGWELFEFLAVVWAAVLGVGNGLMARTLGDVSPRGFGCGLTLDDAVVFVVGGVGLDARLRAVGAPDPMFGD